MFSTGVTGINSYSLKGRASKEQPDKLLGEWFFTLIFCGFTIIPTYTLYFKKHGSEGVYIFGFFALLALAQLIYTFRKTIDLYKFGEVRFLESNIHPALGGELTGVVFLSHTSTDARLLHAELQCYQIKFVTNNKGRTSRSRKRIWYGEGKFPVRRRGRGGKAEIHIPIPYRAGTESGMEYEWELKVHMDVSGIDLYRTFTIEVMKGSAPVVSVPGRAETKITNNVHTPGNQQPVNIDESADLKAADILTEDVITEQNQSNPAVFGLIVANLVPIAGVVFFQWSVQDIVMLYWFENIIIGLMNVFRIFFASPEKLVNPREKGTGLRPYELMAAKTFLIGFFIVHYGGFCFGHGIALVGIFSALPPHHHMELDQVIVKMFTDSVYLISIAVLFSEHLFSFFRNYIGKREYKHVDIATLMFRPYGRIFITHIYIFIGGIVILLFANSAGAIIAFVVTKIFIDQYMHKRERNILATPRGVSNN